MIRQILMILFNLGSSILNGYLIYSIEDLRLALVCSVIANSFFCFTLWDKVYGNRSR